jgi:hypothetical protein
MNLKMKLYYFFFKKGLIIIPNQTMRLQLSAMLLQTSKDKDFVQNLYFNYFAKDGPNPDLDSDPEPEPKLFRCRNRTRNK